MMLSSLAIHSCYLEAVKHINPELSTSGLTIFSLCAGTGVFALLAIWRSLGHGTVHALLLLSILGVLGWGTAAIWSWKEESEEQQTSDGHMGKGYIAFLALALLATLVAAVPCQLSLRLPRVPSLRSSLSMTSLATGVFGVALVGLAICALSIPDPLGVVRPRRWSVGVALVAGAVHAALAVLCNRKQDGAALS
eukprot:CAMPEP_0205825716 /NCGR_PEP_ID=MMETSP0206-20130828/26296_1 /ASSEMBLY_ACC=CAM_ASM_000279 /TAXON_ID=36767 /ORGANISM="Euplotes focardii, Strain TN1" /LENGTH=193 /DNA_ID=CAMNT_0053124999 /DNA_START=252 /DNA_END=830 /DNA_ORIENTATION=-